MVTLETSIYINFHWSIRIHEQWLLHLSKLSLSFVTKNTIKSRRIPCISLHKWLPTFSSSPNSSRRNFRESPHNTQSLNTNIHIPSLTLSIGNFKKSKRDICFLHLFFFKLRISSSLKTKPYIPLIAQSRNSYSSSHYNKKFSHHQDPPWIPSYVNLIQNLIITFKSFFNHNHITARRIQPSNLH